MCSIATLIAVCAASPVFSQGIQMLPPIQSGTVSTLCPASAIGNILTWDGATAIKCQTGIIVDNAGRVGIGTNAPVANLEVVGTLNVSGSTAINSGLSVASGVKIGMDGALCTAAKEGTLRYNSGQIELCTSSGWINPNQGLTYLGSCTTPNSASANTTCKCNAGETLMLMSGYNGTGNWGDSVNCKVNNQDSASVAGSAYYSASVQGTCTFACFK